MPNPWSQRSARPPPTALVVLAAPLLGLLFVVALPLVGLFAIGWGLGRPRRETAARPAGDPEPGHQGPRAPRPLAGPRR
jgi:hypothetical protein